MKIGEYSDIQGVTRLFDIIAFALLLHLSNIDELHPIELCLLK